MNENNALMNETREGRPIRWWYLVAVAAILALALGACSPSQPEVATPAPTVAAAQPTPVFGPVQRLPAAPAQGLSPAPRRCSASRQRTPRNSWTKKRPSSMTCARCNRIMKSAPSARSCSLLRRASPFWTSCQKTKSSSFTAPDRPSRAAPVRRSHSVRGALMRASFTPSPAGWPAGNWPVSRSNNRTPSRKHSEGLADEHQEIHHPAL
jgi:hypothetical protein